MLSLSSPCLFPSLPSSGSGASYIPLGLDIVPAPHTHIVGNITDTALIASIFNEYPNIRHVVHPATLHKPHVGSHSKADFVDVNITGTLALLEAAAAVHRAADVDGITKGRIGGTSHLAEKRIQSFVFISTTSTFGAALSPTPGSGAAWITETTQPIPKNIYGVTKVAAEDLCQLFHRQHNLPVIILRTSRFFPEADDDEDRRAAMGDANLKVCELAYRRVDVEDVVRAVACAMAKAEQVGWGRYIISAPPPLATRVDGSDTEKSELLRELDTDAATVLKGLVPQCEGVLEQLGWKFLSRLDRVYDSSKAVAELGWRPEWTFERVVEKLSRGEDWRSALTYEIGKKGYHAVPTGVYTTAARDSAQAEDNDS